MAMDDITALFDELDQSNGRLWADDGVLRFSAPQPLPPDLLGKLRERKAELLAYLTLSSNGGHASASTPHPLSLFQTGLWFAYRSQPATPLYNMIWACVIIQPDRSALEKSLNLMLERHSVLRSRFSNDGIVIAPPAYDELQETAVSSDQVNDVLAQLQQAPFDLETEPPIKVRLFYLPDEGVHLLAMVAHHLVFDGYSRSVFLRELQICYLAYSQGDIPDLPLSPIQYGDFATWQRRQMATWQQSARFWQDKLTPLPESLPLSPYGQPTGWGKEIAETIIIPVGKTAVLSATTPAVCLAAFKTVLYLYTRCLDIVVGVPFANRIPGTENSIGMYTNTMPIRAQISPEMTFAELVSLVQAEMAQALDHQQYPFEAVVKSLAPARQAFSFSNPIFQVVFTYQQEEEPISGSPFTVIDGSQLLGDVETATPFGLVLNVSAHSTPGQAQISMMYDTGLLEEKVVSDMLQVFVGLLSSDKNWHGRLADIPVPYQIQRNPPLSADKLLHQGFERWASTRPGKIAVTYQNKSFTYQELNSLANRLACHLQRHYQVKANTVVAVGGDPLTMIISTLAVLKAGGAFMPLDLSLPIERLTYMMGLADTAVALLPPGAHIPPPVPVQFVDVESLANESDKPSALAGPESAAYVIYTSGSTGQPKGVVIEHRSAANLIDWYAQETGLNEADVVLQTNNPAFDASVLEVFSTLNLGARLILSPVGWVWQDKYLPAMIERYHVTVLTTVTTILPLLLGENIANLRLIGFGGEPANMDVLRRLQEQSPSIQLRNLYGPTETTVVSTCWSVDLQQKRPLIGKPISGVTTAVLDDNLTPVPTGTPGVLYVSGLCLARGYLNRPDLTAERFVTFAHRRWYNTGDVVRQLPGGDLEYLGRADAQVKVRGYRIETGEIESAMQTHPGIHQVVAFVREGHLVAALVGEYADTDALRQHAAHHLPTYMIPSQFMFVPEIPRLPSGKTDTKALLMLCDDPDKAMRGQSLPERPFLPLEREIAAIWAEVMGYQVGAEDGFFDVGGHSLQLIEIVTQVEMGLGYRVALGDLLREPTIVHMTQLAQARQEGAASLVKLNKGQGDAAIFFVHPASGLVSAYRQLAKMVDTLAYGLQITGATGATIDDMAKKHIETMLPIIQPPNGIPVVLVVGWSMGGCIALEIARHLQHNGYRASVCLIDTVLPDGDPPTPQHTVAGFARDLLDKTAVPQKHLVSFAALRAHLNLAGGVWGDLYSCYAANVQAYARYQPCRYDGQVSLILAANRDHTRWQDVCQPEIYQLNGDHYSILQPPCLQEVAAIINRIVSPTHT